ncbi:hypothetical protein P3102_02390 [Amycolatopsis sp. QT-25]|uniref:hypothetical protein n=1 Tax=Amycolatopsis sp. QT-25 TaxID=3034022 RepID=UPI0023EAF8D4|nr:hypothetical protein [Amycolatopsis sp. QT-25]WET80123.1 hypothetical protein P3102_02390 [Amycolatopsis sp. QT-25]
MKSLVHAARIGTAVGVFALGFVGLAGNAAAVPSTSFEVCSPLGCAVQSVRGAAENVGGRIRVVATVSDSAPADTLIARFVFTGSTTEVQNVLVDDDTRTVTFTSGAFQTNLTVSACGGGGCTTKPIPL